ncbi:MAG: hypothetical protein LUF02_10470 [Erysipelotrichaceae bacterium]|nr:hypothetical protein [Erysipelotrichaceae bacterium]
MSDEQLDYLLSQVNEIDDINYTDEEIDDFSEELKRLQNQIERIQHREEYIETLKKEIHDYYDQALIVATKISDIRQQKAKEFEQKIQIILQDLYLENAIFKIEFINTELTKQGIDKVRFMVSINKGQNLSLLNESASGGEISRIMLAIKIIIFQYNSIDTIIFDEVDSGVSGKIATSIGEKMHELSNQKQVICITHLPQVASLADYHYCIEKTSDESETISSVKRLSLEERINEIAKMLSGEHVTSAAIENAKKLLNV